MPKNSSDVQMEIVVNLLRGFYHLLSLNLQFPVIFEGPGGVKKLREAFRNNFHLFSPRPELGVPSYERKSRICHDKSSNDYYDVSITFRRPPLKE